MVANIIIVAAVGAILFFAVRSIIKNRKSGGCGGCAGCGSKENCDGRHQHHKP